MHVDAKRKLACFKEFAAELLLRERLPILLRPVTVWRHGLHGRPAFSSTGAGPFHLRFSHAEARFGLQAGTDVNDSGRALRIGQRLILRMALRAGGRTNGRRKEQQGKNRCSQFRSICHGFSLRDTVPPRE